MNTWVSGNLTNIASWKIWANIPYFCHDGGSNGLFNPIKSYQSNLKSLNWNNQHIDTVFNLVTDISLQSARNVLSPTLQLKINKRHKKYFLWYWSDWITSLVIWVGGTSSSFNSVGGITMFQRGYCLFFWKHHCTRLHPSSSITSHSLDINN